MPAAFGDQLDRSAVRSLNATVLSDLHHKMNGTIFSLAGKGLKIDTEEDLKSHIAPLTGSQIITHIDFSGNTFGVPACKALAPILAAQKNLRSADLHDIFTSRVLEEIPPALSALLTALLSCGRLHTIDLSDNAFGLNTKEPLVDFLSKHTPLKNLVLNNNGMGPIAGTSIAEALITLASRKRAAQSEGKDISYLQSVVCGRNRLENGSMAAWAKAYEAHKDGIRSVKMTQNGIRPEGISLLIGSGLRHCSHLELLDMQDNTFTFKGAAALAAALGAWPQLSEVGVGDDLLGARGAVKVFEALAKGENKALEIIRLQYNDINSKGVKALLTAAENLTFLRRIELNGNKFDEDDSSVEALARLLSERRESRGSEDDADDHWGLDDLDELEEEDSAEEEGDSSAEAEEDVGAGKKLLREADEAEDEKVAQQKDPEVDDLADALKQTEI